MKGKLMVFNSPRSFELRDLPLHHPFRVFGKKILAQHSDIISPSEKTFLKANALSEGAQFLANLRETHTADLEALLSATPGHFSILYSTLLADAPLMFQGKPIIQLTYIFPFALSILETSQYIQIDASFDALSPYIFTIPLAILHNESLPLGIQISPTETAEHYSAFFGKLCEISHNPDMFSGTAFLSDQGKGLKRFVQMVDGIHFFCYRHILENIGASSLTVIIVRRHLFTSCLDEFKSEYQQAIADLHSLWTRGLLTQKQIHQIEKLFLWHFDGETFTVNEADLTFPQALWVRQALGVTTCSNHEERINRTCNSRTHPFLNLVRRLHEMFIIVQERFDSATRGTFRQAHEVLTNLAKRAEELSLEDLDSCPFPQCQWGEIYSNRFGIHQFPCLHTARSAQVSYPTMPIYTPLTSFEEPELIPTAVKWNFAQRSQSQLILGDLDEFHREEQLGDERSSSKFLIQLTRELMVLQSSRKKDFLTLLARVSTRWGRFLSVNIDNTPRNKKDLVVRAEFRVEEWLKAIT
jgi:hypothetical protein